MVTEPPLVIPFLPGVEVGGALPTAPRRIAAWTASTPAGPSRRLAIAGADNTVWICTSALGAPQDLVPSLSLPAAAKRPPAPRNASASSSSSETVAGRPRASSTASSVLTSTSLRRVLSPGSSTTAITPSAQISATVATAPAEGHPHRTSVNERADLLQHLREQAEPQDDRSSLGLGFSGLTRRGISGVHGKEEIADGDGGARTPMSQGSSSHESGGLSSKITGFLGRPSADEVAADEARSKIEEMEVEREMEREAAEDAREAEDLKIVTSSGATPGIAPQTPSVDGADCTSSTAPMRIVLPEPGRGSIVDLAVLEEINELVVLRDVGLLDVITLSTLQLTKHLSLDHVAPSPSTGGNPRIPKLAPSWLWKRVHLAAREEGAMLVANGEPWPSPWPSPNGEVTRVAMLALPEHNCVANLELPGIGDIGVASNGEASYILHSTPTSLMSYPIVYPSQPRAVQSLPGSANHSNSGSPMLHPEFGRRTGSLHNVRTASGGSSHEPKQTGLAKFLAARRISTKKQDVEVKPIPCGVEQGTEVNRDGGGDWRSIRLHDNGDGVGMGDDHVELFHFDGTKLSVKGSIAVEGTVKDVAFTGSWHDVVVVTDSDTVTAFSREKDKSGQKWTSRKTYKAHEACMGSGILHTVEESAVTNIDLGSLERRIEVKLTIPTAQDHLCPMGADTLYVASTEGEIRKDTISTYLHGKQTSSKRGPSDRLDAAVTYSTLVPSEDAVGGRFLVMGDEDGALRIWDEGTLRLRGCWTPFDDPVRSATLLDMEEAGSLRGMLLCTSARGTVAIITLRDMEMLFVVPAARAPLTRIYIGGEAILLAYEIQKARVWNVQTGEFRRSTGLDSADEMLMTSPWTEVRFQAAPPLDSPVSKVVGPLPFGSDLGRLLQLDLRELGNWLHADSASSPLPALRGLLSAFLTFGMNPAIDEICTARLGISPPVLPVAIGLEGPQATATVAYTSGAGAWSVSPTVTGLRQLAIVSLLRPFLDSPDHEGPAADVVAFYSACLPEGTLEADLELFAAFYLDSAPDVHQAARMLFGARLSRMPNEEIEALVVAQQEQLPSVVPAEERMGEAAARALTMVGGMALHRFSCMNPTALKNVAESIAVYLHDADTTHVGLAIELCSKGFSTWQTYVDAMDLLRRLFYLSTQKELGPSVAAQARLAVLQVATSNAPLFMSTLSMDILDAKTSDRRTSVIKLCVYIARKKPALLENSLPRIAEAVVKSLDPNVGKMRDVVWDAATVILNELVKAFTTIDFNSGTQRLCVGTNEGAVVMYDLKTASRLYVIEPHKHPVSAVSFSPDGRRLVTVSLDEGDSTVWKIGSSISGFFNVGGPPRQGSKAGEPYRRFPVFRAAGEAPMENTGSMSDVVIEWPGPRTARISIRETNLSFETT